MNVAIVGTRGPEPEQFQQAKDLAQGLSRAGHFIHTGGAFGIDQAAMEGAEEGFLRVFLPWHYYNKAIIPDHADLRVFSHATIYRHWAEAACRLHPLHDALTGNVLRLMARNYGVVEDCGLVIAIPQVSGNFGGTNHAIRCAEELKIKVLKWPLPSVFATLAILEILRVSPAPPPAPAQSAAKTP